MRSKILIKRFLFIVSVSGIIFCLSIIFFQMLDLPGNPVGSLLNTVLEGEISAGFPVRLAISKINVDASVEYVGITPAGAMDVPKGPVDVAWLKLGVRPGEIGSAVISGHYGWKDNIPAVFDNLSLLQKGDQLSVIDENGATTTFAVRESRIYGQADDASEVFISSDGKAHLNLITCTGIWNAANKSYSQRLVVFTDKVTK